MFFAEEVIKQFNPELLVVNMTGVDAAHSNFTEYCNNLRKADYAVGKLWNTIQSTPGMANDTILIVVPEVGRNLNHNSIVDENGRYGLDHSDAMSQEIFCLVAGPQGKVAQNQVINSVSGESIDVVPTIAHILGFYNDIPSGMLPGSPLYSAFSV
jgi:arylsulfatase A-like enzyme